MVDRFKEALRQTYRRVRQGLSVSYKHKASHAICSRIRSLEVYRYAKRIALYQAIQGEVNLNNLWRSAPLQGKFCYFPVLNDDLTLSFISATPATSFNSNQFGILEPEGSLENSVCPEQLDVLIMPLVAFDTAGTRLGMGAGYYDRTLERHRAQCLIGVAYEFQRLDYIKPQPWDVPLMAVVTERAIYWSQHT